MAAKLAMSRRRHAVETLQHCFGADLVLPPETPLEELERLVEDTQMEQVQHMVIQMVDGSWWMFKHWTVVYNGMGHAWGLYKGDFQWGCFLLSGVYNGDA